MKQVVLILIFSIFCISCISTNTMQCDINHGILQTRTGFNLHWRPQDFPIIVKINNTIPPVKIQQILIAINDWNNAIGEEVFTSMVASPNDRDFYNTRRTTIIIVEDELGINEDGNAYNGFMTPQVRLSNGTFFSAKIQLDYDVKSSTIYFTTLHELGHALGLAHDCDKNSIMYPYINVGINLIQPNDIQYIRNQI